VRTARLQMLATAPTDDVRVSRPVYRRWGLDYWQQLPSGAIALGGGRDVGGEAEWTPEAAPSAPVQAALDAVLRDVIGTRAAVTHRWAAAVGYATGGLPVLDRVRDGVWACGGYSGTGNVLGWLCGRAAARLASGAPRPTTRRCARCSPTAEPWCATCTAAVGTATRAPVVASTRRRCASSCPRSFRCSSPLRSRTRSPRPRAERRSTARSRPARACAWRCPIRRARARCCRAN
jgi:hypothetical protein